MDIFIEHMIAKQKDMKYWLISVSAILLTLFILVFFSGIPILGIFISAGAIYGCCFIISSRNLEYEYSLTNGELDIDKIISRRKRKRMLSVKVHEIDSVLSLKGASSVGIIGNEEHANIKKIYACSSMRSENLYCMIYNKDGKNMLFFEPTEKMIAEYKRLIPQKVTER